MNRQRRREVADTAQQKLRIDPFAATNLGYAVNHLAIAAMRDSSLAADEAREWLANWAVGAAAFAVAAACSASGTSVEDVMPEVDRLMLVPGFFGEDDAPFDDWVLASFQYLGLASVFNATGDYERAREEAVRAAAVILGALEV
jgi:hypothetical protein